MLFFKSMTTLKRQLFRTGIGMLIEKLNIIHLLAILYICSYVNGQNSIDPVWNPDNGDGTYKNPVIFADYSDPDVIRVQDDFYMVSSSFSHFPGLPILYSKDLVNWKIISHAAQNYPFEEFDKPMHGNGIWAPSIRYHNGEFYIYFGDPDHGILMTKSKNPAGPWQPLQIVHEAKGWIDPCPFWDEDGNAYLVHAWANSRSGIKSILTLNKMSSDGMSLLDDGVTIFDGHINHPTIEGPKLYKRNGFYYVFAPAGGVKPGWQTVLRSKNIYGPYEDKIVLEQGSTKINGPHQGAWVELASGESWFVHFQDRNEYGRVVHLNPMYWAEEWPVMGIDFDGNRIGEPVSVFNKPNVNKPFPMEVPQTNDEFNNETPGLQWQWECLPQSKWFSLTENRGSLRLYNTVADGSYKNLRDCNNVIGQKFPSLEFSVTAKLKFVPREFGERTGLLVFGQSYSGIELFYTERGLMLRQNICIDADKGADEVIVESVPVTAADMYLKIYVRQGGVCSFAYSIDGKRFNMIGKEFSAVAGRWVGAKICLFAQSVNPVKRQTGYADYDWVRFTK